MPRAFIAFPITEPYWQNLRVVQQQIQIAGIRYHLYRSHQFHVTAAFLGELSADQINSVLSASERILETYKPLSVVTKSLTSFPSPTNARALVIKLGGKNSTKLQRQVSLIRKELQQLDIWFDAKHFVPHITLGRIPRGKDLGSFLPLPVKQQKIALSEISLYISQPSEEGGMEYIQAKEYLTKLSV